MKKYNKLVRDGIPEIIIKDGCIPKTRKLNQKEFKEALVEKVLEESKEIVEAKNKKELVKELADLQEVLTTLYEAYGIKCGDVAAETRKRRKERGGFKKKIFLEGIK